MPANVSGICNIGDGALDQIAYSSSIGFATFFLPPLGSSKKRIDNGWSFPSHPRGMGQERATAPVRVARSIQVGRAKAARDAKPSASINRPSASC